MKIAKLLPLLALVAGLTFTGCKPKDADIKANIEKSLKESPSTSGVMVMVNEGVATLSGEVPDAATQSGLDTKVGGIKGVKSVQNNTNLPAVSAAPVQVTADDPLKASVADATKDYPGVSTTVNDGVITVTGELNAERWKALKMSLDALKPRRVDATGLTIK